MTYHSHADLGGEEGHGPVVHEPEGAVFHADWERQVFGMVFGIAMTNVFSGDAYRAAFETLPNYRALSYYKRWLHGLENLLIEHGLVSADEIEAGQCLHPAQTVPHVLQPSEVLKLFGAASPKRPARAPARFAVGEEVRTRAAAVEHHTRLPGYARGKRGRVEYVRGVHVFADTHAHGLGEQPEWLYTVVFTGRELWGKEAPADLNVSIEAWEPYLEPL